MANFNLATFIGSRAGDFATTARKDKELTYEEEEILWAQENYTRGGTIQDNHKLTMREIIEITGKPRKYWRPFLKARIVIVAPEDRKPRKHQIPPALAACSQGVSERPKDYIWRLIKMGFTNAQISRHTKHVQSYVSLIRTSIEYRSR